MPAKLNLFANYQYFSYKEGLGGKNVPREKALYEAAAMAVAVVATSIVGVAD